MKQLTTLARAAALALLLPLAALAQTGNVGIGTTTPDASAALDITSTSKGLLPPRLTQDQRNAIASPATGLTIYNTTTNRLNTWNGTSWVELLGASTQALGAVTFSYTGAYQTYTVPAGVTKLRVVASGAGGGTFGSGGGGGGTVTADLAVTPGEVLTVYVGQRGTDGSFGGGAAGGYNGGGSAVGRYGAGGGGATDLRRSATVPSTSLADRLLAAGGGGGGNTDTGGGGGGNPGTGGSNPQDGGGGTGSQGGSGGSGAAAGQAGSLGQGGNGGTLSGANTASGGGGGYYGGGGGAVGSSNGQNRGSGGGGSSYVVGTAANVSYATGTTAGNGSLTLTPTDNTPAPVLDGTNFVNVPGDNLGNHIATKNLNLGTYQLLGNGSTQGLSIGSGGGVDVSGGARIRGLSGTDTRLATVLPDGTLGASTPLYGTVATVPASLTAPTGTVRTGGSPFGVAVSGTTAYVTSVDNSTLQVFDVSNPASPSLLGQVGTNGSPYGVAVSGTTAYVVSRNSNTLQTFDVSNPASPSLLGTVGTGAYPISVAVSGTTAYVVNRYGNSLQTFNVSSPASPALLGTVGTGQGPNSVAVSGTTAYVVNFNASSLQTFNVSNPASPTLLGQVGTGSLPYGVAVSGTTAYVVNYNSNSLQTFSVSNPASPSLLGTVGTDSRPYAVAVSGTTAYVVNNGSNSLQTFNVSSPASPVLTNTLSTGSVPPLAVAASGTTAYATIANGVLQVYVFTSPPRVVAVNPDGSLGSVSLPNATDYIRNTTSQQASSNFNISGNGLVGGRVGIGTSSPSEKLEIVNGNLQLTATQPASVGISNGQGSLNLALAANNGEYSDLAQPGDAVLRSNGGKRLLLAGRDGGSVLVSTGASGSETERLRVTPAGNVGIGTPTPGQQLEVAGTVFSNSGGFMFPDNTVQTTAAVTATGASFIVNGTAQQAGSNFNVSGNGTVGGTLSTTNAVVATALTGTGADLGSTVGVGITAQGGLNLGQNNGGNLLLGYQAGQTLATNVSTGDGTGNQLVGYQAGAALTTGSGNQLEGFGSGAATTTGYANVFSGPQSGASNTTGYYNQYLGYNAGARSTTGTGNLFVGYGSGFFNTTGSTNTALGSNAGPDRNSTGLTNATALGANAVTTTNNTVVLGNAASVGIGVSNPDEKLQVVGTIHSSTGGFRFPDNTVQATAAVTATGAAGTGFIQNQTATTQTGGFSVDGAGTVGGLLTAGSATINGATTVAGGAISLNTTGTAATSLGNGTGSLSLTGPTTIVGATSLNVTGAAATNIATAGTGTVSIGHSGGTVSVAGSTGFAGATTFTGPTTIAGATGINTSGTAGTTIGSSSSAVTLPGLSAVGLVTTTAAGVLGTANLSGDISSTGTATTYAGVVPASKGGAGTVSGLLRANGAGTVSAAVAGTDYAAATGSGAYVQSQTATAQAGGFNVAGAGTVGGLLTAGSATVGGSTTLSGPTTVVGATSIAGATSINTSGTAGTTIGSSSSVVTLPGLSTAGFVTNSGTGVLGTTSLATLGTNFIQNTTSQQATSNFNISGAGTVGGLLTAGSATVSGKVGVGTSSPGYPLTVQADGSNRLLGFNDASGTDKYSFFRSAATTGTGAVPGGLTLNESGVGSRLFVQDGTGNVGIGTTAPGQKLDVSGNANVSGNTVVGGNVGIGTTTAAPATQKLDVRGNVRLGDDGGSSATGTGQAIEWVGPGVNTDPVGLYRVNPASDQSELRVVVGDAADANDKFVVGRTSASTEGGIPGGTFTPNFTVTSAGSVGIGTSSPAAQLANTASYVVAGDGNGTSSQGLSWTSTTTGYAGVFYNAAVAGNGNGLAVRVASGSANAFDISQGSNAGTYGTSLLRVNGNGNVGIGTFVPAQKLDVSGGILARASNPISQQGAYLQWNRNNGDGATWLLNQQGGGPGGIIFGSATTADAITEWGRFDGSGNLGIGTSSPIARLHVSGSASATPSGSGTSYFSATSTLQGPGVPNGNTARATAAYFDGGQVWVNSTIVAGALNTTSDRRIKHVIGLSDRAADLALLQRLRITDYTYIDQQANTPGIIKKVIAQEVEQVLPTAVTRSTQAIPNVYERATRLRYAQGQLSVTTAKAHELPAGGGRMRFYTPANVALDVAVTVVDAHTVRFASAEAYETGLFVYGKYVDDFRSVDYDALTTLNVSATQELARKVEILEQQNAALKAQATADKAAATATLDTFEARLRRLEAAGGGQAQR